MTSLRDQILAIRRAKAERAMRERFSPLPFDSRLDPGMSKGDAIITVGVALGACAVFVVTMIWLAT